MAQESLLKEIMDSLENMYEVQLFATANGLVGDVEVENRLRELQQDKQLQWENHIDSQMLGIGKNIQSIFNEQVVFKPYHTWKHGDIDRKEDIRRMVKTLQPLHYFSQEEGRAFKGFESFTPINGVRFPKKNQRTLHATFEKRASLLELNEDL